MASDLLTNLIRTMEANRISDIERREKGQLIKGDFDGSVTGSWVKLDDTGIGIVKYNEKEYKTRPIGFTSIPKDTNVVMTYANGIYYSSW